HQMLAAVVNSYKLFPAGVFPDAGSVSDVVTRATSLAFRVGVQITLPFIVVGTLLQLGLGILSRLMPQLQIFFIALPVQIFLSLLLLTMTMSAGVLYWLDSYGNVLSSSLIPQ
ncbi:MAG: flagellar biosynthetic protein FliR, partial [Alphaproteobacteria bacterium]|nr:flagellar biosynthetic protein FliR [Alphaproteobacteria bacterium]